MKLGESISDDTILERVEKQKPGECCCLIYTSGTTGNPKGCMLSHDNMVWEAMACGDIVYQTQPESLGPQNRFISYLPLSHIAGYYGDVLNLLFNVSQLFFARPDAL